MLRIYSGKCVFLSEMFIKDFGTWEMINFSLFLKEFDFSETIWLLPYQIKSFIGPQVNNIHINKNNLTIVYILWPGSYKIAQAVFTWAPLVQHNIMIRFKRCAMCLYGAHNWRRVVAVAVGEQEAETWCQSLQSEIQKVLGSLM